MKAKKKYCLNMSSYKYKSGFKSLLPPIILKESNNLNINIENLIPMQSKCPNGKNCPNYKIILELKQEIFKLIDKISQLKKLAEYSIPNPAKSKKVKRERNINTEKDTENKDDNICNQLINSSKNKFLKLKNISNSQFSFRYNLLRYDKIRERPNSAKISELKESFQKVFIKEKNKIKEKKEKENQKEEEENKNGKEKEIIKEKDKQNGKENNKENELNNINVINKKLNVNYFTLSSRKKNDSSHRNKKYINNLRYNVDDNGNISLTKNARLNKESFSYLGRTRFNDLSSLNLHLSNSIISPAIKVTPKNLFDSIKASEEIKKINKENEECVNIL